MPARDLELLIAAAQRAGKIATGFTGPSAKRWDKPGGAGPVTEADLAVNDMLEDTLRKARPDYGWLSEETEDETARLDRERVFIVDPIDGTRSFVEGSNTWAHALAVAEHGKVTAAVIYLPLRDKLFSACLDGGAFLNGERITTATRAELAGANILAAKPNMNATNWPSGVPDVKLSYRPSLAYRLSLVAQGRYDAMLTLRDSWEWDIAAGALILQEAGALCSDRGGVDLRFNNPHPTLDGVVAAGPALHSQIINALNPQR